MGYSDKDRISVENLYIFKSYRANKKLLGIFKIKVEDWWDLTSF